MQLAVGSFRAACCRVASCTSLLYSFGQLAVLRSRAARRGATVLLVATHTYNILSYNRAVYDGRCHAHWYGVIVRLIVVDSYNLLLCTYAIYCYALVRFMTVRLCGLLLRTRTTW